MNLQKIMILGRFCKKKGKFDDQTNYLEKRTSKKNYFLLTDFSKNLFTQNFTLIPENFFF